MTVLFIAEMLLVGAGVGVLSAALGLGGGILMVPAFMTFAAMDSHTAKGTSICIIIFVALSNAVRHTWSWPERPWRLAAQVAGGSVVGGYLGAWGTSHLSERLVLFFFMLLLVALAVRTFFLRPRTVRPEEVRQRLVAPVLIGLTAGVAAGATGTGGGAVLIPLVLWAGLVSNDRVVGLSNMVMVATSAAGTLAELQAPQRYTEGLYTVGHVDLGLVPLVFLGAQLASPWGKRLNAHLTLPRRRVLMSVLLGVIAVRLLWRIVQLS